MIDVYELLSGLFEDMQISLTLSLEDGRDWGSALDAALDRALTDLNDKIIEVADEVARAEDDSNGKKFRRDQDGHLYLYLNPIEIYLFYPKDKEDEFEYVLNFGDHAENKTHFDSEVEACKAALERARILSEEFLVELARIEVVDDVVPEN